MGSGACLPFEYVDRFKELSTEERANIQRSFETLLAKGFSENDALECVLTEHKLCTDDPPCPLAPTIITGQKLSTFNDLFEEAILKSISGLRSHPDKCLKRITSRLVHYTGKDFHDPARDGVSRVTKEGKRAVEEAIASLKDPTRQPVSCNDSCLDFSSVPKKALTFAAQDHATDIGMTGATDHQGSDLSSPAQRMARYGSWLHFSGECIWYGSLDSISTTSTPFSLADGIIDDLIIDDGVADRGHRLCLLNRRLSFGGVGVHTHVVFGHCVVIDMVANMQEALPDPPLENEDLMEAARERLQRFDDRLNGRTGPWIPGAEDQARAQTVVETQWKVLGLCFQCGNKVLGGRVVHGKLSSSSGGNPILWHEQCFACNACSTSLRGKTYNQVEISNKTATVCSECYGKDFAPMCAECSQRIADGKILRVGDRTLHPGCHKKTKPVTTKAVDIVAASAAQAGEAGHHQAKKKA